ncbi:MAG: hypothetical protein WCN88_01710 [Candidatus Falkowbacteria bacterium]
MKNCRLKLFFLIIFVSSGLSGFGTSFVGVKKAEAAISLKGRILLQVQDKGQAWYVNPLNNRRYYLGRPDDAFLVMRSLGLGVSNTDLNSYFSRVPARLAGRILLKVQDKGQAYYVDPVELKLYYLGRPADAFNVMRQWGLGISNRDLESILISTASSPVISAKPISSVTPAPIVSSQSNRFTFKYRTNNYELSLPMSLTLYNSYKTSSRVYTYSSNNEPTNLREVFYGLFLKLKTDDSSIDEILAKLKKVATANNWSDDQTAEFVLSFVQYIPYDQPKINAGSGVNDNPYFPYETLYLDKGVCSDKTFLAVLLFRKLGYGAAILDFPDRNHTALGIACPKEYSLNNSGYCYGETTNYFPLGVIPQSINNGQAQTVEEFTNLFDSSNLGKIEIYQATSGKLYQGIPSLIARADALRLGKIELNTLQLEINDLGTKLVVKENAAKAIKSQMDIYYNNGQFKEYNNLVPSYNSAINIYNADLAIYQVKVNEYNAKVILYNESQRSFYQL